jgi:hypothetical protein
MDRRERRDDRMSRTRRPTVLALVALDLGLLPVAGRAEEAEMGGERGLHESFAGHAAGSSVSPGVVAALTSGPGARRPSPF